MKTTAESKFLDSLGIKDAEQDQVDLDYLKDVHWERWFKYGAKHQNYIPVNFSRDDTFTQLDHLVRVYARRNPQLGLTYGYIGNMERWGDDRSWRVFSSVSMQPGDGPSSWGSYTNPYYLLSSLTWRRRGFKNWLNQLNKANPVRLVDMTVQADVDAWLKNHFPSI